MLLGSGAGRGEQLAWPGLLVGSIRKCLSTVPPKRVNKCVSMMRSDRASAPCPSPMKYCHERIQIDFMDKERSYEPKKKKKKKRKLLSSTKLNIFSTVVFSEPLICK